MLGTGMRLIAEQEPWRRLWTVDDLYNIAELAYPIGWFCISVQLEHDLFAYLEE